MMSIDSIPPHQPRILDFLSFTACVSMQLAINFHDRLRPVAWLGARVLHLRRTSSSRLHLLSSISTKSKSLRPTACRVLISDSDNPSNHCEERGQIDQFV